VTQICKCSHIDYWRARVSQWVR